MAVALVLLSLPLLLALYAYAVYPLLLRMLARNRGPMRTPSLTADPLVTIVVPAYNEEAQIRGAIESLLAQDYPRDRRQILIVSDASSDGTDAIVAGHAEAGGGVELLRLPTRSGKTAAENASLAHIRGEIVVNCDASVRLQPTAVRRLVEAMADSRVGVASTSDVSVSGHADALNVAEAGYVGYEMGIRDLETRCGGIVGASGSGYAIRATLHRHPVRPELSRDFSAALTAHRQGFRAVAVSDALCLVPRTASPATEYRRKVRTIHRGMRTLVFNGDLLNPMRHGAFAWKLISHKLVRWLVPISCIPALGGIILLRDARWAPWALTAALALLAAAFLAPRVSESSVLHRVLPAAALGALSANAAVLHATWRLLTGHDESTWEPTRRAQAGVPADSVASPNTTHPLA